MCITVVNFNTPTYSLYYVICNHRLHKIVRDAIIYEGTSRFLLFVPGNIKLEDRTKMYNIVQYK